MNHTYPGSMVNSDELCSVVRDVKFSLGMQRLDDDSRMTSAFRDRDLDSQPRSSEPQTKTAAALFVLF